MIKNQWKNNKLIFSFITTITIVIMNIISIHLLSGILKEYQSSSNLRIEMTSAQSNEENGKVYQEQNLQKLGEIPQEFQGKIIRNITIKDERKIIALTFDDGPSTERTNDILYVLKKYNIKATFFVLGKNVQNYPQLTSKIVEHGHAIGNHTWNHPYSQQSKGSAAQQIDNTTNIIYQTTGVKTYLFRPPGGYLNNGLADYAQQKNNAIIMWSLDTIDYRNSSQNIINNTLKNAKSGGIVLLHDGGGNRWNTLIALPHLIEELQQQGYEFVTIPELLKIN